MEIDRLRQELHRLLTDPELSEEDKLEVQRFFDEQAPQLDGGRVYPEGSERSDYPGGGEKNRDQKHRNNGVRLNEPSGFTRIPKKSPWLPNSESSTNHSL